MAKVFISYSHKDTRWLDKLRVHLRPLEREGEIEVWDDRRIKPGMDWLKEIEGALAAARVAVLLVSADFLSSEFIMSVEVAALLTKADAAGCRIIPVILRPCRFSDMHILQRFQAINSPKRPLAKLKSADAEEYFVSLSRAISELVSGIRTVGGGSAAIAKCKSVPKRDARIEAVIRGVRLGDWDSAERAALEIIATTDRKGGNGLFRALLDYQDCGDDSDLLWSALQTIECCAKLTPWLMDHEQLSRMAYHENFSVRSTVASICMEWAEFAPDRVPLDLLIKLSAFDEDWYVEAPANASLKAMVRSCPVVLQIFYKRLRSADEDERVHAAAAIKDIADTEAYVLDAKRVGEELRLLRMLGDKEAAKAVAVALSKCRKAARRPRIRYGL
jgi:TIR domain